MEADRDRRLDHDPLAGVQRGGVGVFARQTHEGDVLHAARHDKAAGRKVAVAVLFQAGDLSLEADGLAVVLLRLLRDVAVPERKIIVADLHDRGVDVKGERVLDLVGLRRSVGVFIEDADAAVQRAGELMQRHDVRARCKTIEHDHLTARELVHHKGAHVGVVGENARAVGKHDLLRDLPVLRHFLVERADLQHAVELDDDALAVVLFEQL